MTTEQKTQLDRANEVLSAELYSAVTSEDRQAAIADLGVSMFSVVQYLKGRGRNLDTAMKLIEYFRKRIKSRERSLASVQS